MGTVRLYRITRMALAFDAAAAKRFLAELGRNGRYQRGVY